LRARARVCVYVCVCILRNIKREMYFSLGVDRWLKLIALQISCVFLLMTLLVYLCLPRLQNLHGKTLMGYMSSLLLAFICLPIITWITPSDTTEERCTTCKALGSYAYVHTRKY